MGKLDCVIEPVDKPALDFHIVLNGLAELVVCGTPRRVVFGMHRFVERLNRIVCATKLFSKKRLRQSIDVVEKNVVDIALERSASVEEQVILLFEIRCPLRQGLKRSHELLSPHSRTRFAERLEAPRQLHVRRRKARINRLVRCVDEARVECGDSPFAVFEHLALSLQPIEGIREIAFENRIRLRFVVGLESPLFSKRHFGKAFDRIVEIAQVGPIEKRLAGAHLLPREVVHEADVPRHRARPFRPAIALDGNLDERFPVIAHDAHGKNNLAFVIPKHAMGQRIFPIAVEQFQHVDIALLVFGDLFVAALRHPDERRERGVH